MRRHLLATLAVAILVTTAGCASVLGPDETTPDTTTPNASTTTTQDPSHPGGFSESGVDDAEVAVGNHKASTLDAGSWTVAYNTSYSSENQTQSIDELRYVNHSASTQLSIMSTQYGEQQRYLVQEEGWMVQQAYNQTQYVYAAEGYNSTAAVSQPFLTSFFEGVNYTFTESVERNGTTVFVYESVGVTEDGPFDSAENATTELQNVSSTVKVTSDGQVTDFEFSATEVAETRPDYQVAISLTFSKIGATVVEEPGWLDEAKNETTQQTNETAPTTTPSE